MSDDNGCGRRFTCSRLHGRDPRAYESWWAGPGHLVNLERALAIGDRMGGHMVLGHVDAVATVLEVRQDQVSKDILLSLPVELQGLVAEKGSIAIDGISLTVTYVYG